MSDLTGKTAVITGGGRGIGEACAVALAEAGVRVVVGARSTDQLDRVVETVKARGGTAFAHGLDVTDPDSVDRFAGFVHESVGPVQILVNNAGIASSAPVHRQDLGGWNRIMAVNATGTFLCTRAFMPDMLEAGWGRVVNVASVAGVMGAAYISAYTASKHAVVGFTRAVAAEVASKGVTVNAVCPGYVDTDMTQQSIDTIVAKTGKTADDAEQWLAGTTPLGRLIRPREVADAVRYLCGDGAAATNGQAIVLDGGGYAG